MVRRTQTSRSHSADVVVRFDDYSRLSHSRGLDGSSNTGDGAAVNAKYRTESFQPARRVTARPQRWPKNAFITAYRARVVREVVFFFQRQKIALLATTQQKLSVTHFNSLPSARESVCDSFCVIWLSAAAVATTCQ